jgi:hypothetical protein
MGIFSKKPEQQKVTGQIAIPEQDQLDSLRMRWLARLLEAGGDQAGANLALSYAQIADAYNEAKQMLRAFPESSDWAHRKQNLKDQLREERRFWRELREAQHAGLVRITNEDIEWPTDAELLAGA